MGNKNVTESQRRAHIKAGQSVIDQASDRIRQMQRMDAEGGHSGGKSVGSQLDQLADAIGKGEALLKLLSIQGVDLRIGGPVGLGEFPLGAQSLVLHPFGKKKVKGSTLALA